MLAHGGATPRSGRLRRHDGPVWRPPPTDFKILRAIHEAYYDDFVNFVGEDGRQTRASEPHVPIGIELIAESLDADPQSIFGRLYHHLDRVHGEPRVRGEARRSFFVKEVGNDKRAVNFPLLEAVLAELWVERRRDQRTYWTAVASLAISVIALVVAIVTAAAA